MKIFFPEDDISADANEGDTLLDVIRSAGLPIEAVCSGRGTCGKCLVRVGDESKLACETPAEDGMRVVLISTHDGQEILTEHTGAGFYGGDSGRVAIAIDIGTTTVVIKALDTGSGRELGIRAFTNPQRVFGADVLSRMNHSMDDASELSGLIKNAVEKAVIELAKGSDPEGIVIAGNTTMIYLLMNLRCRSLGLAPFLPEFEVCQAYSYAGVFGNDTISCPVRIYPFISAFVGGDIVSGLVNIERHLETLESPSYMLVDMGTNGEIAYRSGSRLITTSTAAGPALEGGNITNGMSGLPGAIYEAACSEEGVFTCKTIGGAPPAGICGSGVISIVAALLDAGLLSETGVLECKEVRIADDIVFTQKDVREFQLAKGAIRAGIDILTDEMGEPPAMLYLAGGFGQNIDLKSAIRVGLIPARLKGCIEFAGNTSLGGCIDACMYGGPYDPLPSLAIAASAEEINLGSHKDFNNKFMENMMLEETE